MSVFLLQWQQHSNLDRHQTARSQCLFQYYLRTIHLSRKRHLRSFSPFIKHVYQFDQICRKFATLVKNQSFWQFVWGFIRQNFQPTLAKHLCSWACYHCSKYWTNTIVIWSHCCLLTYWCMPSFCRVIAEKENESWKLFRPNTRFWTKNIYRQKLITFRYWIVFCCSLWSHFF